MQQHSSYTRGQVLIILLGTLFLGGSAATVAGSFFTGKTTKEIGGSIKKCVDKGERRDAALEVVDLWTEEVDAFVVRMKERTDTLLAAFQDHGAARETIEAAFSAQDADGDAITRRVIDLRFELRGHLTPEEWSEVFSETAQ